MKGRCGASPQVPLKAARGGFAQHSEDEERSQATATSPEHPWRRSPVLSGAGMSQSLSGCLRRLSCSSGSFRLTLLSYSLPDPLHRELEAMHTTMEQGQWMDTAMDVGCQVRA